MATAKRKPTFVPPPSTKCDRVSGVTRVGELLFASLAREEDKAYALLADERMNEKNIKWLSHNVVWGA